MTMIDMIGGGAGLMFRVLKNYQEDEKRNTETAQRSKNKALQISKKNSKNSRPASKDNSEILIKPSA
jgi:hypothetical protein